MFLVFHFLYRLDWFSCSNLLNWTYNSLLLIHCDLDWEFSNWHTNHIFLSIHIVNRGVGVVEFILIHTTTQQLSTPIPNIYYNSFIGRNLISVIYLWFNQQPWHIVYPNLIIYHNARVGDLFQRFIPTTYYIVSHNPTVLSFCVLDISLGRHF